MPKNMSRWSPIMGSWTASSNNKVVTPWGTDSLSMYVITHLNVDSLAPTSKYECGCDSIYDNEVCKRITDEIDPYYDRNVYKCVSLTNNSVTAADATIYFDLSIKFDINELKVHQSAGTGGWLGPYSVLLPDDDDDADDADANIDNANNVSNTYLRYATTTYTPLLRHPLDYDLTSEPGDFSRLFGMNATEATIDMQTTPFFSGADPFAYAYNTCDNGDAKPILPIFEFTIDDGTGELTVKFQYRVFVYPDTESVVYNHKIMQRLKAKGWPISGPYCFNGILSGWTFDFDYDSSVGNGFVNFNSGCEDGLPCLPEAFEGFGGGRESTVHSEQATVVQLSLTIYLVVASVCFLLVILGLCCFLGIRERRFRRRIEELETKVGVDGLTEKLLLEREEEEGEGVRVGVGTGSVSDDVDDIGEEYEPLTESI